MASQDTAANKVVLPPSCNSHHPQRHRYRAQDDASSATAAVSFGPWGADDADNFVEFRPATFCCSVSSSSSTEQPPPQSYRKSAKDWAASSTSITTDQVGSWCESVETPIACVFPARQVSALHICSAVEKNGVFRVNWHLRSKPVDHVYTACLLCTWI